MARTSNAKDPLLSPMAGLRAWAATALLALIATIAPAAQAVDRTVGAGPAPGTPARRAAEAQLARPATALAAGHRAVDAGNAELALWLLAETAWRHPIIADYADLMRGKQLVEMARHRDAIVLLEHAMARWPDSRLVPDFSAELGEAYVERGNEEGARRAWRRALDVSKSDALRATLLAATARSQQRSGDAEGAAETWTVLWHRYPISPEAARAEAALDRLETVVGVQRTPTIWRRRADQLYRKRRNPAALAAYQHALAAGLPNSETERVEHRIAQTLFRMREYPRAVEAFGALRQTDDIPIWHARSLARAGHVPEAIREFEKLATRRRGQVALRARFLAALLLDGRNRFDEARHHLESLTQGGSRSAVRRAALWRLAWGAYREERYAEAIGLLDQLIRAIGHPMDSLRSRYWRARCLEELTIRASGTSAPPGAASDRARALEEFAAIASEYPLSYYGWRARTRLPEARRNASTQAPRSVSAAAPAWTDSGKRKLASRDLERARILLEAGLEDDARATLRRARGQVGGLRDRLELAEQLRNAGNFASAQRLVLERYTEVLARGPAPTYEELWWHAWPAAFIGLVRNATSAEDSVSPSLVLSIMREESGFRPAVVSPVGARGLLQIMEPTGKRLAKAVGHPDFTADDLFDPMTNIRLGSYYLGELYAQFDGRLSAAIASYNAGPAAVGEWIAKRPSIEDDEWVESIPYDETRGYVKRVLRSLQAYDLLY